MKKNIHEEMLKAHHAECKKNPVLENLDTMNVLKKQVHTQSMILNMTYTLGLFQ